MSAMHRFGWSLWLRPVLTLTTLALSAITLPAQRSELRDGARVRLRAPTVFPREVEGAIVARHGDTLVFAPRGTTPVRLAADAVTAAAIYRGRSSAVGVRRGALWGAGIGLGLGILSVGFSDCSGKYCDTSYRVMGTLAFGAVGAGIGGVVGARRGGDRWERLAIP